MKTIILIFFFFLLVSTTWAHPHVFIDYSLTFDISNEHNIKGFWVNLQFDELFSSSIIEGADEDKNKKFSKKEIKLVYDEYFQNLKNYNYYLHVNNNGKIENFKKVTNFTAYIKDDDILGYKFFVPLKTKKHGKLSVAFYDQEYYCAMEPMDTKPFTIIGNRKVTMLIRENEKKAFYFDQIIPTECDIEY